MPPSEETSRIHNRIDGLTNDVTTLKAEVSYLKSDADKKVTKESFATVKLLVYGFAGLILTGAILGLVKLVIK